MTEDFLPSNIWDTVRNDYLMHKYTTVSELAARYKVSVNTLNDHIHKGRLGKAPWKYERSEMSKELLETAVDKSKLTYIASFTLGADIVERTMKDLLHELTQPMEPIKKAQIAKTVVECLHKLQSILRLEDNQSTQNIAINHTSQTKVVQTERDADKLLKDIGIDE